MDVRDVVSSLMIVDKGDKPIYNRLRKLSNDKWVIDELAGDGSADDYVVVVEGQTQHSSIETAFIALMATPYWR